MCHGSGASHSPKKFLHSQRCLEKPGRAVYISCLKHLDPKQVSFCTSNAQKSIMDQAAFPANWWPARKIQKHMQYVQNHKCRHRAFINDRGEAPHCHITFYLEHSLTTLTAHIPRPDETPQSKECKIINVGTEPSLMTGRSTSLPYYILSWT